MAKVSLTPTGEYSVVDIELLSAEITGRGVMQDVELDKTDFATDVLENGQCVVVKGKTIKNPTSANDLVLLNATPCEIYTDYEGRSSFAVKSGKGSLPRLFALDKFDVFSTNAVYFDDSEFNDLAALKTAVKNGEVVVVPDTSRDWKITKEANLTGKEKVYGEVTDVVDLSNERTGVRISVR